MTAIKRSHLSQKEIATRSGISAQALNGIILKNVDPKISTMESIAKVIGIKMSILFDENNIEINNDDFNLNDNTFEIIKGLTNILNEQRKRIDQLTDKLLDL